MAERSTWFVDALFEVQASGDARIRLLTGGHEEYLAMLEAGYELPTGWVNVGVEAGPFRREVAASSFEFPTDGVDVRAVVDPSGREVAAPAGRTGSGCTTAPSAWPARLTLVAAGAGLGALIGWAVSRG